LTGKIARNPLAFTGMGGNAAIKGGGHFQGHQWSVVRDPRHKAGIQAFRITAANPNTNLYARFFQSRNPRTRNPGIRVFDGNHHAGQSGFDQSLGTGAGFAGVITGFQTDISRATAGLIACPFKGFGFTMGTPTGLSPPAPNHCAI
jgi:hypothetical protein